MDCAIPRASDLPRFKLDHSCSTPCTRNPLGVKGYREAGAIGSPVDVVNPGIDALRRGGHDIAHLDMPLTPSGSGLQCKARERPEMCGFELMAPKTVTLMDDGEAQALSSGQTLVPVLKQRLAAPSRFVSLRGIDDINFVRIFGGSLCIGGATTHAEVARKAKELPALARIAGGIGDPAAVRNRGTIGGSLGNNDPSACSPSAALATGATIVTKAREIPARDFFLGLFSTALEADEFIVEAKVPVPKQAAYRSSNSVPRDLRGSGFSLPEMLTVSGSG